MSNRLQNFKAALHAKPQLGFCSMYPAPGIIERIGQNWDWCWIDAQHGQWGLDSTIDAVRACGWAEVFSLVRTPSLDPGVIGKLLDTACHALMAPMVDTPEIAGQVVRAAHFAPLGQRSYGGRRPIDLMGRAYAHPENPQPLLICQIETPCAMDHLDGIAATPGVDGLFFGPDDMSLARGMPMDQPRPEGCYDAEMAAVAEAAKRHGKIAGGIFNTPTTLQRALKLGYRLIVGSGDVPLLSTHSAAAAKQLHGVLADPTSSDNSQTPKVSSPPIPRKYAGYFP